MTQVQFPISIGLVGAPSSGKKKVTEEFVKISADYFAENDNKLSVIETSGEFIQEYYDQAMGLFASARDELWGFFTRLSRERLEQSLGNSYISLGTAVDSLAHSMATMEAMAMGFATPDLSVRLQKQQMATGTLTWLFAENFRYTFGFYIPFKQGVLLPGQEESEVNYAGRVDAALQAIFQQFGLRIQVLDEPTYEEKAQSMFDTIKNLIENGPEEQDEEVPPQDAVTLAE